MSINLQCRNFTSGVQLFIGIAMLHEKVYGQTTCFPLQPPPYQNTYLPGFPYSLLPIKHIPTRFPLQPLPYQAHTYQVSPTATSLSKTYLPGFPYSHLPIKNIPTWSPTHAYPSQVKHIPTRYPYNHLPCQIHTHSVSLRQCGPHLHSSPPMLEA